MLKNATENTPAAGLAAGGRRRSWPVRPGMAAEYATATGVRLQVVDGGDPAGGGPVLTC